MSWQDCAALVEQGDPDRFMSAMAAPPAGRAMLFPLYAFNLELAKAPWVTSEPQLAEIRLQWWRDAIAEIYEGRPPRRHEVVTPLAEVITARALPRNLFDAMIDARGFDIYDAPHMGRAGFDAYITATAGNLMQLAVLSLGGDAAARKAAGEFGYGCGVGVLLSALPALYASGRNPIPVAGDLDRNALIEGRMPEPLASAIKPIAADARARIAQARKSSLPGAVTPALLHGWRIEPVLNRAVTDPASLLTDPPVQSEFARRFGFLWRSMMGRW
ncbi:phytoene synthase [Rubricella aquisinus]|uniref:Phytoene synthase n=1 Tax=Rubricella aquisinus TaxID=2028108 RepID=A0A840X105_9RHOB|nr:squalene/phytoene synthase family protein [Rubricella aquisinus]MBB5515575.1 phytoene synthase [Rubricella aquisinus]